MKHIVVLSGAGMSAESGIKTFRDNGGLWENHRVEDVATPQAWNADRAMVQKFYNQRRQQLLSIKPNRGHRLLAQLEAKYDVHIITQNVDDLHERAGSSKVLHLHGELRKARSQVDDNYIIPWDQDLTDENTCPQGLPLRPHIVWFGEEVPMIDRAIPILSKADICLVVGTSMQVYPAAGLVQYVPDHATLAYIDPKARDYSSARSIHRINQVATRGLEEWIETCLD